MSKQLRLQEEGLSITSAWLSAFARIFSGISDLTQRPEPHKTVSCFLLSPIFPGQCSHLPHSSNLGAFIPQQRILPPLSLASLAAALHRCWHTAHRPCHASHWDRMHLKDLHEQICQFTCKVKGLCILQKQECNFYRFLPSFSLSWSIASVKKHHGRPYSHELTQSPFRRAMANIHILK